MNTSSAAFSHSQWQHLFLLFSGEDELLHAPCAVCLVYVEGFYPQMFFFWAIMYDKL